VATMHFQLKNRDILETDVLHSVTNLKYYQTRLVTIRRPDLSGICSAIVPHGEEWRP